MRHSYIILQPRPEITLEFLKDEGWKPRDRCTEGDPNLAGMFQAVGFSLTGWESIEGELATIYANIIDRRPHFDDKYYKSPNFQRKHELFTDAINSNVWALNLEGLKDLIDLVLIYSSKRNDIAHGKIVGWSPGHFLFCPNTTLSRHWPDGAAAYQWNHTDISHYGLMFFCLAHMAEDFTIRILENKTTEKGS